MKPVFRIVIDGRRDITDAVRDRLLSLTVTDESGRRSDVAEIRIDDRGGAIALPRRGAEMKILLGYEGQDPIVTGTYTVDEIELSGPPQTLSVRARAVDLRGSLKAQKTRSWDDVTLGGLVGRIAADHDLEARVGSALRSVRIPHLDQTEESDLNLLTRLAQDYDAVAKQAGGYLLLVPQWESASATGKSMPAIAVRPEDVRQWRVVRADRNAYGSVRAHWHEAESGERRAETAGSGDPVWTLRRLYASAEEAAAAARSKLAQLARSTVRLSLELSLGDPAAAVGAELRLTGFRDGVDGSWMSRRVAHKLVRGGYSTAIEAEIKAA